MSTHLVDLGHTAVRNLSDVLADASSRDGRIAGMDPADWVISVADAFGSVHGPQARGALLRELMNVLLCEGDCRTGC